MKLNQDAREGLVLEQFKQVYLCFPAGKISKGQAGTEPDFIIEDSTERIGIELTELPRNIGNDKLGILPQANLHRIILSNAERAYAALNNKKYKVYISFNEKSDITKKTLNPLVNFLVETINSTVQINPPRKGSPVQLGISSLFPYENQVHLIQIYDFSDYHNYSWEICNSHSVESLNLEVLHERISSKEGKLSKGLYTGCNQVWLLLYIDFWNPAMDQQIHKSLLPQVHSSGFQRIVIFKTTENICETIYSKPR